MPGVCREQHTVTRTKAPSYVTIVPPTDKAEHPSGPGKGKLFIGSRCIFTEQPKRMNVELRGIKPLASTGPHTSISVTLVISIIRWTFYLPPANYFSLL